ncbi:MAG: haloacid dehalogenase [Tardiphaga sp.]|nr:haloacid dehalogenase [Tardiphaga sp.]
MSEMSVLLPDCADALLFDLGRVVIDIDFTRTLECWAGHARRAPAEIVARFSHDDFYQRHEVGAIEAAAYFESLRGSLGIDITTDQFLDGWNALFVGEMPGIAGLLAAAAQLPLYAFSNTNAAHVAYFSEPYAEVLAHFRKIFLSSSIGLRKPNRDAYEHVIEAIGVPAGRIVFFDDLADNIAGARACGLNAVHVTSPYDVARALAALGLLENKGSDATASDPAVAADSRAAR